MIAHLLALLMATTCMTNDVPQRLYKVLSIEDWEDSQGKETIQLPLGDCEFIHFSTQAQLPLITKKYFSNLHEYVILEIDTTHLPGHFSYEKNPGGSGQLYYHLYDGSIPLSSVVDVKKIVNE